MNQASIEATKAVMEQVPPEVLDRLVLAVLIHIQEPPRDPEPSRMYIHGMALGMSLGLAKPGVDAIRLTDVAVDLARAELRRRDGGEAAK